MENIDDILEYIEEAGRAILRREWRYLAFLCSITAIATILNLVLLMVWPSFIVVICLVLNLATFIMLSKSEYKLWDLEKEWNDECPHKQS